MTTTNSLSRINLELKNPVVEETQTGCIDVNACNYDADLVVTTNLINSGFSLCKYKGCTDSIPGTNSDVYGKGAYKAINYDPLVELDCNCDKLDTNLSGWDKCCRYSECGCTDPLALNYNINNKGCPTATNTCNPTLKECCLYSGTQKTIKTKNTNTTYDCTWFTESLVKTQKNEFCEWCIMGGKNTGNEIMDQAILGFKFPWMVNLSINGVVNLCNCCDTEDKNWGVGYSCLGETISNNGNTIGGSHPLLACYQNNHGELTSYPCVDGKTCSEQLKKCINEYINNDNTCPKTKQNLSFTTPPSKEESISLDINKDEIVLSFNTENDTPFAALEILDLGERGIINVPMSATQKTIETNIKSIIKELTPTVTTGTGKFLKCGKCGKTGKENGVCLFGGCLTIIPIRGGGKGSITWTF